MYFWFRNYFFLKLITGGKKMKKLSLIKIIMIALTMTFLGLTRANADDLSSEEIREKIIKKISFPEFAKQKLIQGKVKVIFGFNESGSLIVYSSVSKQFELADYVKDTISKIQVPEMNSDIDKLYSIEISFKLL
jgi:hypothetical protein